MIRTLVCLSLLAAAASAAVLHVPGDHADIAAALGIAAAGDEVVVSAGTYLERDLVLPSGVILRGATGDPADVVIDAERLGRCLYGIDLDASTRIEALTLSNGLPAGGATPHGSWGGGLMVENAALTIQACVFTGNETAIGGGAYITGAGAPHVLDCVFDGNEASEAAGLLIRGACEPVVRGCVFRNGGNTVYGGGLTWTGDGEATVEDCLFEDNEVIESGGAVEVYGGNAALVLRDCTIRGNTAGTWGGGLSVGNNARATLESCTITENEACGGGGGVEVQWNTTLVATGTTLIGNTAPMGADGAVATGASATLTCCTVDAESWLVMGELIVETEGCGTPNHTASWGEIKSMFR